MASPPGGRPSIEDGRTRAIHLFVPVTSPKANYVSSANTSPWALEIPIPRGRPRRRRAPDRATQARLARPADRPHGAQQTTWRDRRRALLRLDRLRRAVRLARRPERRCYPRPGLFPHRPQSAEVAEASLPRWQPAEVAGTPKAAPCRSYTTSWDSNLASAPRPGRAPVGSGHSHPETSLILRELWPSS